MRNTMMFAAACVAALLFTSTAYAQATTGDVDISPPPAQRYLVTIPHTPEQCLSTLDAVAQKKMLKKVEWGCKAGDHTGYMILEAPDQETALKKLPESVRSQAKAIELTKFTTKDLKALHAKMDKGAAPAKK